MNQEAISTKQKILDTASRLFHQQGYNSTGINQIIKEAGVAKGSLYHLFKSKEELCVEYLTQRHISWLNSLTSFTSKVRTAKSRAVAAFDFIYEMNKSENFRGCSFLNIISEISPEEKAILVVIQRHKHDLRNFFRKALKEHREDTIDHVYILFEGSIIESQLFRQQWPVEKAKKFVTALLK
jgi:AcrR family transcriptional regulator